MPSGRYRRFLPNSSSPTLYLIDLADNPTPLRIIHSLSNMKRPFRGASVGRPAL
ncbi:MAG: hypothetical protein WCY56_03570 [Aminobacteriaceae bacterium]